MGLTNLGLQAARKKAPEVAKVIAQKVSNNALARLKRLIIPQNKIHPQKYNTPVIKQNVRPTNKEIDPFNKAMGKLIETYSPQQSTTNLYSGDGLRISPY